MSHFYVFIVIFIILMVFLQIMADIIDKKIIYELDNNSRQPLTKLAKKLRTSQQVISYRVNKLVQEGVITAFMTVLSTLSLGLPFIVKLYVQLTGISKETEEDIFLYLIHHKDVNWLCKTMGDFDLFTAVMVKDLDAFGKFKREFFGRYGVYINRYEISFLDKAYTLPRNYLLNKKPSITEPRLIHGQITKLVTEKDRKIIRYIVDNSRMGVVELAKLTQMNVKTIIAKIKEYENTGVIQGYRINLNRKKLNLHYYKVFIKIALFNQKEYKQLFSYLLNQDYLIHLIECIGNFELELEIEMPTPEQMQTLIKNIRNQFALLIDRITVTEIIEEMKLTWLPRSF